MIKSLLINTLAIVGGLWSLGSCPVQASEPASFHYDGVVVDQQTRPLAGATVKVIGTDRSATTDARGAFSLSGSVPAQWNTEPFPLMEISATGYEPSTFRPDSLSVKGLTTMIWAYSEPKEGGRVDHARWAYQYRKGFAGNPLETRWLPADDAMFCGLLFELGRQSNTDNNYLELEFSKPPQEPEKIQAFDVNVDPGRWPTWWGKSTTTALKRLPNPEIPDLGNKFKFRSSGGDRIAVRNAGSAIAADQYAIHVYGNAKWRAPLDIEIEWGFQDNTKPQRWDGNLEVYLGYVTGIQPLVPGSVEMLGQRHWRDNPKTAERRGLRARVWLTSNPTDGYAPPHQKKFEDRTVVTLWTSAGNVGFAPSDLDKGPILIPSLGICIRKQGDGLTAAQVQQQIAASGLKTIRQKVREHSEINWTTAMAAMHPGKVLPPIPKTPADKLPGMLIDVPEPRLNDQWRWSSENIQATSHKQKDGNYIVSIWGTDPTTALGIESYQCIRTLDLIGIPHIAEGGLNYWLLSQKPVTPKGNLLMRDNYCEHKEGHGRIQATAGFHYKMTRNQEWLKKVLPELLASHEYSQQLRQDWGGQFPRGAWAYGLLPPFAMSGDLGGHRMLYRTDASFYEGMREIADLTTVFDPERGRVIAQEAEDYRQAIRRSEDRTTALTAVMKVQDGTYHRYMPTGPYTRGHWTHVLTASMQWMNYHDNLANGLSLCWRGVYDAQEPIIQDTLDVVEDLFLQNKGKSAEPWFDLSGYQNQCGHEPQSFVHFLAGDVAMANRSMYTGYASEVNPTSFRFQEHPASNGFLGDANKSFEAASFLERLRMVLVQEDGDNLWLSRFSLREWFEQGKKISVTNSPTFFGPVDYEIVSDVDNGKIKATVKMPSRNPPKEVRLSLRHPKSAPIKSVTVNGPSTPSTDSGQTGSGQGKEWKDFNKDKEYIILKGLSGTVTVTAQY